MAEIVWEGMQRDVVRSDTVSVALPRTVVIKPDWPY